MTNVPSQPTVPKFDVKYIFTGSVSDLPTKGHHGEVVIYKGKPYVWVEGIWESLESGSVEDVPTKPKKMKPSVCSQCGAPLHGSICEYCGTEYR